jgi:hypothetical protein
MSARQPVGARPKQSLVHYWRIVLPRRAMSAPNDGLVKLAAALIAD